MVVSLAMMIVISTFANASTLNVASVVMDTGTISDGNVASLNAVDSDLLVIDSERVYETDPGGNETFRQPDDDVGVGGWVVNGCSPFESWDCINDDPLLDGDGDATYLSALEFSSTEVQTSDGIPENALIVTPEPILLIRARTTLLPLPGTDLIEVDVYWRDPGTAITLFCSNHFFNITLDTYANYGVSMPNCLAQDTPWNVTMLNNLQLVFLTVIPSNPNIVHLTMAYVRTHHQSVLYTTMGFTLIWNVNRPAFVFRVEWNCTREPPPDDMFLSTHPSTPEFRVITNSICTGADENNTSVIFPTDVLDGELQLFIGAISGYPIDPPEEIVDFSVSFDRFVLITNATVRNINDWGGSICWWLIIIGVLTTMVVVIYIKKSGRGIRSSGR